MPLWCIGLYLIVFTRDSTDCQHTMAQLELMFKHRLLRIQYVYFSPHLSMNPIPLNSLSLSIKSEQPGGCIPGSCTGDCDKTCTRVAALVFR